MVTVSVTIGLAFLGYLATYLNGLRLAQRQARITRINLQLSDFYGPLFALMESNTRTYEATAVFIPNIRAMREVIVTKADLLVETEVPPVLLELCAHVSGYEVTAARWSAGHYDEHLSLIKFPGEELSRYTRERFALLKGEQTRLLGRGKSRSLRRA
ncbi:hypothetical protein [Nocardia crassostreae]|uniref:hypothetical protein n=1 Tax=Nocardia crassostreae TaxID=53428 RepID=UPI000831CB1F|nr:hypothetical protein [Nocardia crassostreae]